MQKNKLLKQALLLGLALGTTTHMAWAETLQNDKSTNNIGASNPSMVGNAETYEDTVAYEYNNTTVRQGVVSVNVSDLEKANVQYGGELRERPIGAENRSTTINSAAGLTITNNQAGSGVAISVNSTAFSGANIINATYQSGTNTYSGGRQDVGMATLNATAAGDIVITGNTTGNLGTIMSTGSRSNVSITSTGGAVTISGEGNAVVLESQQFRNELPGSQVIITGKTDVKIKGNVVADRDEKSGVFYPDPSNHLTLTAQEGSLEMKSVRASGSQTTVVISAGLGSTLGGDNHLIVDGDASFNGIANSALASSKDLTVTGGYTASGSGTHTVTGKGVMTITNGLTGSGGATINITNTGEQPESATHIGGINLSSDDSSTTLTIDSHNAATEVTGPATITGKSKLIMNDMTKDITFTNGISVTGNNDGETKNLEINTSANVRIDGGVTLTNGKGSIDGNTITLSNSGGNAVEVTNTDALKTSTLSIGKEQKPSAITVSGNISAGKNGVVDIATGELNFTESGAKVSSNGENGNITINADSLIGEAPSLEATSSGSKITLNTEADTTLHAIKAASSGAKISVNQANDSNAALTVNEAITSTLRGTVALGNSNTSRVTTNSIEASLLGTVEVTGQEITATGDITATGRISGTVGRPSTINLNGGKVETQGTIAAADAGIVNLGGENNSTVNTKDTVTATNKGTINVGGTNTTEATLEKALLSDGGTVNVAGTTIEAKETVTAQNNGAVKVGGDNTTSATVDGNIATESGGQVTVAGSESSTAKGEILANDNSMVTVGKSGVGTASTKGKVTADGTDAVVNVLGDTVNAGTDAEDIVRATDSGKVNIGEDGSTNQATVNGAVVANGGTVNVAGTTVEANETVTAQGGGEANVGGDNTRTATVEKDITATNGTVNVTGKESATANGAVSTSEGGAVTVEATDAEGTAAVNGNVTATGEGSTVSVKGDNVIAGDSADDTIKAEENGTVNIGEDGNTSQATVNGAVDANGGTVNVAGTTVEAKDTVTAQSGGEANVGGDNTRTATVEKDITATNGTVNVTGKESATANGAVSASEGGAVTVEATDAEGTAAVNGNVTATGEGSTVSLKGDNVIAGDSADDTIKAEENGTVNIGEDGSTSQATVNGAVDANGGTVNVAGTTVEANETVTAQSGGEANVGGEHTDSVTVNKAILADNGTVNVAGTTVEANDTVTAQNNGIANVGTDNTDNTTVGGEIIAKDNGTVNVKGKNIDTKNVNTQDSGTANIGDDNTTKATVEGTITADNGTVNVVGTTVEAKETVTAQNNGTANVGTDNTDNTTVGGEIIAKDNGTVNVKGKNIDTKNVNAQDSGTANIGDDNTTKATVEGTITADNGTVNVAGTTVEANDTVTAQNSGTANVGTDNTNNTTVGGDITAKDNGTVNVKGKNIDTKNVNAQGSGIVNVGNDKTEKTTVDGNAQAIGEGSLVSITGQEANINGNVSSDQGGRVEVNGSTVDVQGNISSDNQGKTNVSGDGITVDGDITSNNQGKTTVSGNTVTTDGKISSDNGGETTVIGKDSVKPGGDITSNNGGITTVKQENGDLDLSKDEPKTNITAMSGGTTNVTAENGALSTGDVSASGSKDGKSSTVNLNGKPVNLNGSTTASNGGNVNVNGSDVNVNGEVQADGEGSKVTITGEDEVTTSAPLAATNKGEVVVNGKNITTDAPINANTNGQVTLNGDTVATNAPINTATGGMVTVNAELAATIKEINQAMNSTVSINSPKVTIDKMNANGATLAAGKDGSTIKLGDVGNGVNVYKLNLAINPKDSSFLEFDKSPVAGQKLQLADENKYNKLVVDLKEQAKLSNGITRVPFATVKNPTGVDAFAVNSKPIADGFDVLDLYIGKDTMARANTNDKLFTDGHDTLPASDFYYVQAQSVGMNPEVVTQLEQLTFGGMALATDMIHSVRAGHFGGRSVDGMTEGAELNGIWARYSRVGYDVPGFTVKTNQTEFGYDHIIPMNRGTKHIGVSFEYISGSGDMSGGVDNASVKRLATKLYDTTFYKNGAYTNYVAAFGRATTEGVVPGDSDKVRLRNNYVALSAEYGMHKQLGEGWYVVPNAQLQYTHVNGDSFTMYGTNVDAGAVNSLQGRAGILVGYNVPNTTHKTNVYGTFDVFHEFAGTQSFTVDSFTTYRWNKSNRSTWYKAGLGTTITVAKSVDAYVNVAHTFGGDSRRDNEVNVGVQVKF